MVYNIPASSKVSFTQEEFCALFRDERIFGMKFTDTNYYQMERIKAKTGVYVYSGADECYLSALAAGADGAIGTTFNFMLKKYIEIRDAFRKGENERALRVMASANNVTETIIARCLPCTKYVLTLQGIDAGECRGPFAPVTEEEKRAIRTAFENNL